MDNLPLAEKINYWKSGSSTPDTWFDKCEKIIEGLGGQVLLRAIGRLNDQKAFLFQFKINGDTFKIIQPVLPTRNPSEVKAAERQAATIIYHDIKSRLLRMKIFGARVAFFEFLQLPNGKTLLETDLNELNEFSTKLLNQ